MKRGREKEKRRENRKGGREGEGGKEGKKREKKEKRREKGRKRKERKKKRKKERKKRRRGEKKRGERKKKKKKGEIDPNVSDDKIKFFGLIYIIVVTATIPLILPHLTHPSMVYHILLHIASLTIAIFLCSIAVAAYFRGGRTRLLFMALGFITLAALEVLLLLSATEIYKNQ